MNLSFHRWLYLTSIMLEYFHLTSIFERGYSEADFIQNSDLNETKYMKLLICEEEPSSLTTGNIVTLDKMTENKLSKNLNTKASNPIITSNPLSRSRRISLSLQDINKS